MKTERLRRVAKHDYPKFEVGLLLDDTKGVIMGLIPGLLSSVTSLGSGILGGLGSILSGLLSNLL